MNDKTIDVIVSVIALAVVVFIVIHLVRIWRRARTWEVFVFQLLYHEVKFLPYIAWKDKQERISSDKDECKVPSEDKMSNS